MINLPHHFARLQDFIEERRNEIYPEHPSQLHTDITNQMIERLNALVPLEGKKVLDCGCGQGVALKNFKERGANPIGITFGEDYRACKQYGFDVYEMDQSFLDFQPNTFDVIWCRHALEHSLFPLFTLKGFYEALKPEGILYIEVPAPDTLAHHETNLNHYSCFTKSAWVSLLQRSKFKVVESSDILIKLQGGDDVYHSFFLQK